MIIIVTCDDRTPIDLPESWYDIGIYCFLISADISVLHSNCTGSDSSPTVQIFFHIAHPEIIIIVHLLLHTRK